MDKGDNFLIGFVGQADAAHQNVFRHLVGLRFDHDHLFGGGGDAAEHFCFPALLGGGVDEILAV